MDTERASSSWLSVAPGAQVGGDLVFGAGQMTMDGAVAGSVLGSAGSYTRGGSVAGGQRVNLGQPPRRASRPWPTAPVTSCAAM